MPTTPSEIILKDAVAAIKNKSDDLKKASLEEFIETAYQIQNSIAAQHHLNITIRKLDPEKINHFLENMKKGNGGLLMFRHGEQDPGPQVLALPDEDKKIAMMGPDHNRSDPITSASAVEFIGTMMMLAYIQDHMDYKIVIESSENQRAQQPARALSEVLGLGLELSKKWTCIDYAEKIQKEELKSLLDKGNLAWDEKKIDAVVGKGTYHTIFSNVEKASQALKKEQLRVVFTHTQQLQAAAQFANLHYHTRLNNYGFFYHPFNNLACLQDPNGFYSTITFSPEAKKKTKSSL